MIVRAGSRYSPRYPRGFAGLFLLVTCAVRMSRFSEAVADSLAAELVIGGIEHRR